MKPTINQFIGARAWFPHAKFGMFVHFGLYSLLGGNENDYYRRSKTDYERLIHRFNPKYFDADAWVRMAESGGCRYIILTAKHGEGFCMWDTRLTAYKITNTPFGRDLLGELAAACRRRSMRFGIYYGTGGDYHYTPPGEGALEAKTFAGYFAAQIRELTVNYGRIDEFWFDGSDPRLPKHFMKQVLGEIRTRQPSCVINDRGFNRNHVNTLADFVTPERYFPQMLGHPQVQMEICDAMGLKSWGYHREERFWSSAELIRRLSRAAGMGANYLLNVEPMPDGRIRPECAERLRAIGRWLKINGEAIFDASGCRVIPAETATRQTGPLLDESHSPAGVTTSRDKALYIHLHQWPLADQFLVPHVSGTVKHAHILGNSNALKASSTPAGLQITGLPAAMPDAMPAVIKISFSGPWHFKYRQWRQDRRKIIPLRHDEPTVLPAEAAELTAEDGVPWHTISKFTNHSVWITNFYRYDGRVTWRLSNDRPDVYELYADMFAPAHKRDAIFSVRIARQLFNITMTEGGSRDQPLRIRVGQASVPKGRHTVIYRLRHVPHRSGPDLLRLVLIPGKI